jgi:hypothetical protein
VLGDPVAGVGQELGEPVLRLAPGPFDDCGGEPGGQARRVYQPAAPP